MAWAAYWWLLSRGVKPAERIESVSSRLMHVVPLVLTVALLWAPTVPIPGLGYRFFPWAPSVLALSGSNYVGRVPSASRGAARGPTC